MSTAAPRKSKVVHDPLPQIELAQLDGIRPASVNDAIYKPVDPDDPDIRDLAESIRQDGLQEPLVISRDNVLVSGHRRRVGCLLAGLRRVPVRRLGILSTDPGFERLLVTFNKTRDKDPAERVREQLVLTDPDDCYASLLSHRVEAARVKVAPLSLEDFRPRKRISAAKLPFLRAIQKVLDDLRDYWPVSDRRVHYNLLNDPPLIHANKPGSVYKNDKNSYKAAIDILTRGRLTGDIPMEAIGDETRPMVTWAVHPNVTPYVQAEVEEFLADYHRDLTIGQPSHVEIVGEKLTVEGVIRPVASRFCLPYTIGRGFSSLPPRKEMFDRFKKSGKERLVILFLSDHDPEGESIPESFARSMRDDFGVGNVHPVKVGLTAEQVRDQRLPRNTEAKEGSSRFKSFARRYGRYAYELEAVRPDLLQQWLDTAARGVLDTDRLNQQIELERRDAATLAAYRSTAFEFLQRMTRRGSGS